MDILTYPTIQVRAIMRELTFPLHPSSATIFNFGVMAFSKAIDLCLATLTDKQRRALFDLKNAQIHNDAEKIALCEAQYEAYRLLIFDFSRMKDAKEEKRIA